MSNVSTDTVVKTENLAGMLKKVLPKVKNPNSSIRMVSPMIVDTEILAQDEGKNYISDATMVKKLAESIFFGQECSGYSFEKLGDWLKPNETASIKEFTDYAKQVFRRIDVNIEFTVSNSKAIERSLKLLFADAKKLEAIGLKRINIEEKIDDAWFVKIQ